MPLIWLLFLWFLVCFSLRAHAVFQLPNRRHCGIKNVDKCWFLPALSSFTTPSGHLSTFAPKIKVVRQKSGTPFRSIPFEFALLPRPETKVSSILSASNNADNPRPKRIFVLGGDGFCGWPTSLYLSSKGHEVIIIDNLSRRKIDVDCGTNSLTPINSIEKRVDTWNSLNYNALPKVRYINMDVAKQYADFVQLMKVEPPDAIIHFAEQRAAPFSMKGSREKRYTVENNIGATHNLLCSIVDVDKDIHVIHLGTMGVYGYGTSGHEIPEGYIDVTLDNGRRTTILHPANPGSVYHTTKCLDALLFQFYNKNDGVRITDLHQGIVWGTNTPETSLDERLINRFDYDSDYGTVLNRFIMQNALGLPLTVYGTGGQTRAFIHIQDTCRCIELALNFPPQPGQRVQILNQIAETLRLLDLANIISKKTGIEIKFLNNPRKEDAENELQVSNKKFRLLGLNPIQFDTHLTDEVEIIANKYKHRVNVEKIAPLSYWNKELAKNAGQMV